jgi:hypothetical protein
MPEWMFSLASLTLCGGGVPEERAAAIENTSQLLVQVMSKIRSRKQQNKQPLIKQIPRQAADDDISDTDKWRIIEQSGVLKNAATQSTANEVDQDSNTLDYVLQAVFLAFPFSFLFATFEVTVQVQYSEPWSYRQLGWRMLHVLPGENHASWLMLC